MLYYENLLCVDNTEYWALKYLKQNFKGVAKFVFFPIITNDLEFYEVTRDVDFFWTLRDPMHVSECYFLIV